MTELAGIIFDLDGTLVDSAADLRGSVNAVLAAQGRRAVTLAEAKSFVGDGLEVLLGRAFAATGATMTAAGIGAMLPAFLDSYRRQVATVEHLYPGAAEMLARCRTAGLRVGLCTNKLYEPTRRLMAQVGLADAFDAVAGCDTFAVCKPHPGHVRGVVEAMGCVPGQCVMVGDGLNDIRSAQGAGVKAIAVTHGYTTDITGLGADEVIDGFAELPDALTRLGFRSAL